MTLRNLVSVWKEWEMFLCSFTHLFKNYLFLQEMKVRSFIHSRDVYKNNDSWPGPGEQ